MVGDVMQLTAKQYMEKLKNEFGQGDFIVNLEESLDGHAHAMRDTDFKGIIREFLLSPIIKEGDLTFLYASKGVGKTCIALPMAYAVALGEEMFGLWKASKPHTVLYVDGEIGKSGLALRRDSTRKQFSLPSGQETSLWLLSDRFNMYAPTDRKRIEDEIAYINDNSPKDRQLSFLIVDNLTSMNGGHDKPEEWDEFFNWLKVFANMGISVLIIYHANRDGTMRGSQMKLVNADNMIYLEDPRICGEDAPTAPKGKKISKVDKLPEDRSKIALRVIPENLRNNQYPEAYLPIEIEYSVIDSTWSMPKLGEYQKEVLCKQAEYKSDEEMAPFWGVTTRQVKEMRKKYGITKNKPRSPGQDGE